MKIQRFQVVVMVEYHGCEEEMTPISVKEDLSISSDASTFLFLTEVTKVKHLKTYRSTFL